MATVTTPQAITLDICTTLYSSSSVVRIVRGFCSGIEFIPLSVEGKNHVRFLAKKIPSWMQNKVTIT